MWVKHPSPFNSPANTASVPSAALPQAWRWMPEDGCGAESSSSPDGNANRPIGTNTRNGEEEAAPQVHTLWVMSRVSSHCIFKSPGRQSHHLISQARRLGLRVPSDFPGLTLIAGAASGWKSPIPARRPSLTIFFSWLRLLRFGQRSRGGAAGRSGGQHWLLCAFLGSEGEGQVRAR